MEEEVEECGWTARWWGSVQEEQGEEPDDLHLCDKVTVCEPVYTFERLKKPQNGSTGRLKQTF